MTILLFVIVLRIVLVGLLGRGRWSSGVGGSSGGSGGPAGGLVFLFVFFDCFGLEFFVSFVLELFGLFTGPFQESPFGVRGCLRV